MISLVIADDHPVVRDGLVALLSTVEGLTVLAAVESGAAAVAAARSHRPDVIIMDLQMADSGIDATRIIAAEVPATRVLVLTMFDDDESVLAAMLAGASGYLLKGATQVEIRQAIETIASGGVLLSAAIAQGVLNRLRGAHLGGAGVEPRQPDGPNDTRQAFPDLTPREKDVLDRIADGANNGRIASDLHLSVKTVANHVSNILLKIQAIDRSEAIVRARRAGFGSE